jgi:tetratricopeptide (TPR) repeat protein
MWLVVFVAALLLQSSATPIPPSKLLEVQSLIDGDQWSDAETLARTYLTENPSDADGHFLLGYILFRRAEMKESLSEYAEGSKYREPGALDLAAMGGDAFLLGDYPAADRWFQESLHKDPESAAVWYQMGRTKYNEKHFQEAVDAFKRCLNLEPGDARAGDFLGLSYEGLGMTSQALAAYQAAVSSGTSDPGPWLDLGTLLVETGHIDEALPNLSKALQLDPQNAQAHRELGKAYLLSNRPDLAQPEVEAAAAREPDNAPVHFLLAQVYRKRGLTQKADAETERFAALTGTHSAPETSLEAARSLLEQGKPREAETAVRGYLRTHPQSGDAHFLLGYILFKQQNATLSLAEYTEGAKFRKPTAADLEAVGGDYVLLKDYTDADVWFSKAVDWNPKDALGWYYLGRTKYNENRFDEAVTAFQKCLDLNGKDVKAEDNLGLSYEGLNRVEDAMSAYRTAIQWQSDTAAKDAGPYLNLGSLMVENGRENDGLPYLAEAAKLAPADYRVHRVLGKAYAHAGDNERARLELEKAVALDPNNAPVHFMLSQVYRKLGMAEKARLESEQYVKLNNSAAKTEN